MEFKLLILVSFLAFANGRNSGQNRGDCGCFKKTRPADNEMMQMNNLFDECVREQSGLGEKPTFESWRASNSGEQEGGFQTQGGSNNQGGLQPPPQGGSQQGGSQQGRPRMDGDHKSFDPMRKYNEYMMSNNIIGDQKTQIYCCWGRKQGFITTDNKLDEEKFKEMLRKCYQEPTTQDAMLNFALPNCRNQFNCGDPKPMHDCMMEQCKSKLQCQ